MRADGPRRVRQRTYRTRERVRHERSRDLRADQLAAYTQWRADREDDESTGECEQFDSRTLACDDVAEAGDEHGGVARREARDASRGGHVRDRVCADARRDQGGQQEIRA